jgi:hypothetical protein
MQIAHHRGKMLYEIRPDIIPHQYLTPLEIELWGKFFEEMNLRNQHGRS